MSLENYLSAKSRDRHNNPSLVSEESSPKFSIKDILARKSLKQQEQAVSDALLVQEQHQPLEEDSFQVVPEHKSESPVNPYQNIGKVLLQAVMMTKNSQSIFQSWKRVWVKLITSNETEGAVFAVYKEQESITASLQIIIPEIHSVQKTNYKSAFSRFGNGDARKSSFGFMIQLGTGDMIHFSCESVSSRDQFVDVLQELIIQVQQYNTRLERLNYEQYLADKVSQDQQMIDVYEFDQESRFGMSPTSFIRVETSESPVTQQIPPFHNQSPIADPHLEQPAPRRNITAHFITHPSDVGFDSHHYSESPDFTFQKVDDIEGESPMPLPLSAISPSHGGMVSAFQEDKEEINRIVDELKDVKDENDRLRNDLESNRIMETELSTIRDQLCRQQSLIRQREEQHIFQLAQQQHQNDSNDSSMDSTFNQSLEAISQKISDLHSLLIDKHQKQIEAIDTLQDKLNIPNEYDSKIDLSNLVANIKTEIENLNNPLVNILQEHTKSLKELREKTTSAPNVDVNNLKINVDAVGESLKEISEFLSKNADLQNRSETAIHSKMDQILSSSQSSTSYDLAKFEKLLNELKSTVLSLDKNVGLSNEVSVAGFAKQSENAESIKEHITDSVNQLVLLQEKLFQDINKDSTSNNGVLDLERKLDDIQTALDQTQSMVLSGNMSSSHQHLPLNSNDLEGLQKQFEALSANVDASLKSFVESQTENPVEPVESTFMKEFREEMEAKISNIDKNVTELLNTTHSNVKDETPANMGLALLARQEDRRASTNLIYGRPRALSPVRDNNGSRASLHDDDFDTQSIYEGESIQDINRNLTNLKLRLNSFISATLSDNKMQIITNQLNDLKDTGHKTRSNVQTLNDSLQSSDNAWRTELRHILRSYHEQMIKLEESVLQVTQTIQHQKIADRPVGSSPNVDNEMLLERITQLVNNNYGIISEDLQQVQHTFSKSLNELMQDREILMRENQRLLTDVEQLKHNLAAGKESQEDLELAKLREEKDNISKEIDTQLKWLTALQSVSKSAEQQQTKTLNAPEEESLNRSRVQTLLTEIDALKIKRSIIGDILGTSRGPATPPNGSPKKRSVSFNLKAMQQQM